MMTSRSAIELSMWIALNHPQVFTELARRATAGTRYRRGLGFLGDDAPIDIPSDTPDVVTVTADASPAVDTSSFSSADWANYLASQGANVDLSAIPTTDSPDTSALYSGLTVGAPTDTIQPVTMDVSGALQSTGNSLNQAIGQSQVAPATDASGTPAWLSVIGSGLSSAVTGVAGFLTSPQGLTSLAGVAGTYFNSQAQQAVLQTQVARAQAGQSPAPIGYAYNAAGQLIPAIVNPRTGTIAMNAQGQPYPVTPQTLAQMGPGVSLGALGSLSNYWPLLLIGGGALLFFALA